MQAPVLQIRSAVVWMDQVPISQDPVHVALWCASRSGKNSTFDSTQVNVLCDSDTADQKFFHCWIGKLAQAMQVTPKTQLLHITASSQTKLPEPVEAACFPFSCQSQLQQHLHDSGRNQSASQFEATATLGRPSQKQYALITDDGSVLQCSGIGTTPTPMRMSLMQAYTQHAKMISLLNDSRFLPHLVKRIGEKLWQRLYPYQQWGVAFMIAHDGKVLLGDEPGLGKTIQVLAVCQYYINDFSDTTNNNNYRNIHSSYNNHNNNNNNNSNSCSKDNSINRASQSVPPLRTPPSTPPPPTVLIVCPANAKQNWAKEIVKHFSATGGNYSSEHILKCETGKTIAQFNPWQHRFVLCSFALLDSIHRYCSNNVAVASQNGTSTFERNYNNSSRSAPPRATFEIVVVDESENVMNYKTLRQQNLLPIIARAKRRILLSGTPMNRPKQLFAQLHIVAPDLFANFFDFAERYCNPTQRWVPDKGEYVTNYDGFSNITELSALLKMSMFLRRTIEEVASDLPAKTRECVVLKRCCTSINNNNNSDNNNNNSNKNNNGIDNNGLVQPRGSSISSSKSSIEKLYQTSIAKREPVLQWLRQWWRNDGANHSTDQQIQQERQTVSNKVLLFAHHQEMMDALEAMVRDEWQVGYIRIDGSITNNEHRGSMCDRFQTDPQCRVALLAIKAAGMAITLTAANLVVFAELYFTCSSLLQCEARAHRIGQLLPVHCWYLLLQHSIDEKIWKEVCANSTRLSLTLNGQSDIVQEQIQHSQLKAEKRKWSAPASSKTDTGKAKRKKASTATITSTKILPKPQNSARPSLFPTGVQKNIRL
jgi:hypothetical protein